MEGWAPTVRHTRVQTSNDYFADVQARPGYRFGVGGDCALVWRGRSSLPWALVYSPPTREQSEGVSRNADHEHERDEFSFNMMQSVRPSLVHMYSEDLGGVRNTELV